MLRLIYFMFIAVSLISAGCGGSDDAKKPAATADSGTANNGESTSPGEQSGVTSVIKPKNCGNGSVEGTEECDDGNNNDLDSCTNLCTWACKTDSDCTKDVSDQCSGGSLTCETASHTCKAGAAAAAKDGEKCGDNAWCYEGRCLKLACNNGVKQGTEECDDGNPDDTDGCTKKCTYTCGSQVVGSNIAQNACDPTSKCDPVKHVWIKGKPLENDTFCDRGTGYCKDGVCVYSVCGDGTKSPNEGCDDGEANGTPGKCTKKCTIGVCGNKTIEEGEECDDGNPKNLDGCDYRCKAEVTYRGQAFNISTEDAPDGCPYATMPNKGNAFKSLFPVDPSTGTNAILDLINSSISDSMAKGEMVVILQGIDVDDYTGKVPDPSMMVGLSIGKAKDAWPTDLSKPEATLDIPVLGYKSFFENDLPTKLIRGETALLPDGTAVIRSTAPVVAGFNVMGMNWELSNMFAYLPIDKDVPYDHPKEPASLRDDFKVPSNIGNPFGKPLTGYFCGAFTVESFEMIPYIKQIDALCIQENLGSKPYRPCNVNEGDKPLELLKAGKCDSFYTVFKGGCHVADGMTILAPIGEPDVSVDGKPAHSTVVRVAGQRARLVGLADPPDGGAVVVGADGGLTR
jgi:cysteine-rich repeat protein